MKAKKKQQDPPKKSSNGESSPKYKSLYYETKYTNDRLNGMSDDDLLKELKKTRALKSMKTPGDYAASVNRDIRLLEREAQRRKNITKINGSFIKVDGRSY